MIYLVEVVYLEDINELPNLNSISNYEGERTIIKAIECIGLKETQYFHRINIYEYWIYHLPIT